MTGMSDRSLMNISSDQMFGSSIKRRPKSANNNSTFSRFRPMTSKQQKSVFTAHTPTPQQSPQKFIYKPNKYEKLRNRDVISQNRALLGSLLDIVERKNTYKEARDMETITKRPNGWMLTLGILFLMISDAHFVPFGYSLILMSCCHSILICPGTWQLKSRNPASCRR